MSHSAEDINFWRAGNRGIRVLLIEDEPDILDVMTQRLEAEGYHLFTATCIKEAWKVLEANRVHIVISDLRLPDGDGLELVTQLKMRRPECQTIVVTGHGSLDEAIRAMRAQAIDFLQKPLQFEDLLGAISRAKNIILHEHQSGSQSDMNPKKISTVDHPAGRNEKASPANSPFRTEILALIVGLFAAVFGTALVWFFKK